MNSEPLYDPSTIQLDTSLGYYPDEGAQRARRANRFGVETARSDVVADRRVAFLASGWARTPLELSREMSYDSGPMTRMVDCLEKKAL